MVIDASGAVRTKELPPVLITRKSKVNPTNKGTPKVVSAVTNALPVEKVAATGAAVVDVKIPPKTIAGVRAPVALRVFTVLPEVKTDPGCDKRLQPGCKTK